MAARTNSAGAGTTGSLFPEAPDARPGVAPGCEPAERPGRVFLLDGTALAYRSHFALIRKPLTTSTGQNVSALYIFATTLFRILEKEKPDYLAVAFDPPGRTFRHDRFEDYKATRQKTPDELIAMLPALRDLVGGFNVPIIELPGYEADDTIGTLAVQAARAGHDVFIVTGDKDFLQIVSPRIKLYNLLRPDSDVEIQGVEAARGKFGVGPEQVIDVLALMGDSSDNVPGVSGIGPKTASELVVTLGGVEQIYAQLDRVKSATVRARLEADKANAFLSRELVTIRLDVPIAFDPDTFRYRGPDAKRLAPLFQAYEMNSLMQRVSVDKAGDEHRYVIVRDLETYERMLACLRGADAFTFDTETTGLDPLRADLVGLSLSIAPREAYYLATNLAPPLFHDGVPDRDHFLADLKPLFADPRVKKRAQNAKYDLHVLRRAGVEVDGVDFDTMLASYCIAPGELQHNLDHLALKYLNFRKVPTTELIGKGKSQITMDLVPVEKAGEYACEDVDVTQRLVPLLERELRANDVDALFRDIEMPLVPVLLDMESAGVAVDVGLLASLSAEFQERLDALQREIHDVAGEEFNINSPQQLGRILFEKLEVHKSHGRKRPRKTRTGWSTDAAVLESLSGHPLAARILQFRELSKLKGTYVDALPRLVHPDTGRIHTSFNQAVAATGRLSSSDPNLQNIPIRTEEGRKIRRAFVPGAADAVLVSADYSQIELRIMAHLSGDENLRRAFREGVDVHRWTAGLIFGMPAAEVPPELRGRAKTINFGVMYGMGPQRLAAETGMTVPEAVTFIEAYFKTFAGVKRFLDATLEGARANGYVKTLLGRRRAITEFDSEHARVAAMARNVAINTPIQGTAADLIKVAMIRLHRRLRDSGLASRMLLQVHDELVFEAPCSEVDALTTLVRETMEGAIALDVPLVVDVGAGANWLEAH